MNKEEAERQAQELLDYYGSGKYKIVEEITMPDGRPGVRVTGCVPTVTDMSMSTDRLRYERTTHFQGFAELAASQLKEQGFLHLGDHIRPMSDPPVDLGYEHIKRILAQSYYDFAKYVIDLVPHLVQAFPDLRTAEEVVSQIPDMTAWPEQQRDV